MGFPATLKDRGKYLSRDQKNLLETEMASLELADKEGVRIPEGMLYLGKNPQGAGEFLNLKDDSIMILVPAGVFTMGIDSEDRPMPLPNRRRIPAARRSRMESCVSPSENRLLTSVSRRTESLIR